VCENSFLNRHPRYKIAVVGVLGNSQGALEVDVTPIVFAAAVVVALVEHGQQRWTAQRVDT
jgi:hypothetical protein